MNSHEKNVLNEKLETCSLQPLTGFNRNGDCRISAADRGRHGVCAQVTRAFLEFTRRRGNDLYTPDRLGGFPGLKPGDRWCLCEDRWQEAFDHGVAPPVIMAATHARVLDRIPLARIETHALATPTDG
ncbi:hypothetical protein DSCA_58820 [Desulfosarcina alkanivorans]|jgi:uncharacterized protein (DUF2237 family)|uniref:DUF2237 domain-containing protein n=1 Tax=Desulfosarcina alkanivorans TaxID=571177 RepID=A0A5K7YQA7_9BACT|nr:DUF2237 domain-containing protein [Desulfosarcina alkanivorans]BBO71952.1 hypothetical protein DSCA_58820 [Desulfosarcina alkanivorans]